MTKKFAHTALSTLLLSLLTAATAQAQSASSSQNAENTLQLNFMTTCSCLLRPPELYKRPAVTFRGSVVAVVAVDVKRSDVIGMSQQNLIEKYGTKYSQALEKAAQAACTEKRSQKLEDYSVQVYSCSPMSVGVTR